MITGILTIIVLCGVEIAGVYTVLRDRNHPTTIEEIQKWFYD
ncbi:hypothetical protein [Pontibacillus yanchengensis]|nr:hypothetical protein [Pontibacillus yanchengensis]